MSNYRELFSFQILIKRGTDEGYVSHETIFEKMLKIASFEFLGIRDTRYMFHLKQSIGVK